MESSDVVRIFFKTTPRINLLPPKSSTTRFETDLLVRKSVVKTFILCTVCRTSYAKEHYSKEVVQKSVRCFSILSCWIRHAFCIENEERVNLINYALVVMDFSGELNFWMEEIQWIKRKIYFTKFKFYFTTKIKFYFTKIYHRKLRKILIFWLSIRISEGRHISVIRQTNHISESKT